MAGSSVRGWLDTATQGMCRFCVIRCAQTAPRAQILRRCGGRRVIHQDFCAQAAKEGWILCLPQPASIVSPERSVALTEDVLGACVLVRAGRLGTAERCWWCYPIPLPESHVLMRSPYFKRGYQSVHGKLVKLSDGSITTLVRARPRCGVLFGALTA